MTLTMTGIVSGTAGGMVVVAGMVVEVELSAGGAYVAYVYPSLSFAADVYPGKQVPLKDEI